MNRYLIVYVRHDSRLKFNPFNAKTGKAVRARRNATLFTLDKRQQVIDILHGMIKKNPAFEFQLKEISL